MDDAVDVSRQAFFKLDTLMNDGHSDPRWFVAVMIRKMPTHFDSSDSEVVHWISNAPVEDAVGYIQGMLDIGELIEPQTREEDSPPWAS